MKISSGKGRKSQSLPQHKVLCILQVLISTHQSCGQPEHGQEGSGGGESLIDAPLVVAGFPPHLHILTHYVLCEAIRDDRLTLLALGDVLAGGGETREREIGRERSNGMGGG